MSAPVRYLVPALLALSLAGNVGLGLAMAHNWVDVGTLYSDMNSSFRHQQEEVRALRTLTEKLAAGEKPMMALRALGEVQSDDGWLVAGPLRVKFEGEQLIKVCGAVRGSSDSCSEGGR